MFATVLQECNELLRGKNTLKTLNFFSLALGE